MYLDTAFGFGLKKKKKVFTINLHGGKRDFVNFSNHCLHREDGWVGVGSGASPCTLEMFSVGAQWRLV